MGMRDNRMPAEVLATAYGDHPGLPRLMITTLQKQRDDLLQNLPSAKDWADFRNRVGQLDGLDIAINFANEAMKKLEA